MTYLDLVNAVLARLREDDVATVTQDAYSKLIGKYVNDVKRQVEDAWNWDALNTTINVTTTPGTSVYTVVGSGRRQKDITVNDVSSQARINNVKAKWILDQQQLSTVQRGSPIFYAWIVFDGTESKVVFFPTPDGAYTVSFNMVVPQVDLSADGDVITVPSEPVISGAYARAIVERGEDGGLTSGEAYGLYRGVLSY